MKITKTKIAAASFGAAMTSLYSAPELSAQITDINFSGTVPFNNVTSEADSNLNVVQFTNVNMGSYGGIYGNYGVGAVGVFNNIDGVVVDNMFPFLGNGPNGSFNGGLSQFAVVEPGDFFTNGTTGRISFEPTSTGVRYVGFVAGGALGWFSIDLGQPGDEVVFLGGQFDIGGTLNPPFPEPNPGIQVGVAPGPDTLLGDVDLSGVVDFLDIAPFIGRLSSGEFQAEADIDGSGVVDFLDIAPFIGLLSSPAAPQVSWSDSNGKPVELKLADHLNAALLAQVNGSDLSVANETKPASVGLAALALGAAGIRRRRQAAVAV